LHCAGPKYCAGMNVSAADSGDVGDAADRHGSWRTRESPVAELSIDVFSPALQRAIPEQRTRVIGAGRERARTIDAVYGHGHGGTRWPGGRVAELAVEVAPPALHGPVSKESARVLVPAGDGDSSGETAHRDRNDTEL